MEQALAELFQNFLHNSIFTYFLYGILSAALVIGSIKLHRIIRAKRIGSLVYFRSFITNTVQAGETTTLTETVYNKSILPLFKVDINFYIRTGLILDETDPDEIKDIYYITSRFNLWPFSKTTRIHTVKCVRRGYYMISSAEIFVDGDYHFLEAPADIHVYPRGSDFYEHINPSSNIMGEYISRKRFSSDPFTMNGIREYKKGDPLNTINSKATARSFKYSGYHLMVNSTESTSQYNSMIYFNFNIPHSLNMPIEEVDELFEWGLRYTVSIITDIISSGGRIGFASNSETFDGRRFVYIKPDGGRNHHIGLLKHLSTIATRADFSFNALIKADFKNNYMYNDVYIITLSESDISYSRNLIEKSGANLVVIPLDERRQKNEIVPQQA